MHSVLRRVSLKGSGIEFESVKVLKIAIICDKALYGLFLFFVFYLYVARLVLAICYNYVATCWFV